MRRTALLVMLLLVAACGGQRADGERPGFPTLTSATAPFAGDTPPAEFDQATRASLVLFDADLPTGLRHLVVSQPHRVTVGEPDLFPTGEWVLGRAEAYRPRALTVDLPGLREPGVGLSFGTHVAPSVAEASAIFAAGRSDARFDAGVEVTDLELGDEAVLLDIGRDEGDERQVVVRRLNVLAVVTAFGPSSELPDVDEMIRLAGVLDHRVAAAIAGEPAPTEEHGLGTSPARQLDSFEFRFSSTYELSGGASVVISTGEFEAPDHQTCEIDLDGTGTISLLGDAGGLALPDPRGHRYLDDQMSASIGPVCLGSSRFFDITAEMFDESAYIAVAGGEESWSLETVNGTLTRHYSLDSASVVGLFGEQAPDRFDIWFDAADGWPVRLDYEGLFSAETVLGPSVMSSQENIETSIRIDITRPNDPSIVVLVPDEILPAGGMSS